MTSKDETSSAKARTAAAGHRRSGRELLSARDLAGFAAGTHDRLYDWLGAHRMTLDGVGGVRFAVWAPAAKRVSVIGDFNNWDPDRHALAPVGRSGVWAGHVPNVRPAARYKYHIESRFQGYTVDKSDPLAYRCQTPPDTASVVWELDYDWRDADWMAGRSKPNALDAPWSIYEMHLGSWKRSGDGAGQLPGYRALAAELVPYLLRMNFTHVELLPPYEHPFYGSWGYQITGYFAPTNRYGSPQDLMYLIDELHRNGIGVIFDWVASHFPKDEHGLVFFDGTHLYEHHDPRLGHHPDWNSAIFNYGSPRVRSFLISSAMFWLDRYHVDGLRVDAVASMLYRDYSRKEGEWIPNRFGGRENIEAITLLRRLNDSAHARFPDARTIAEESTTWPMVSRPTDVGGLGFDMKWDMGWMHDTLDYLGLDPLHRKSNHEKLTFRMFYAFSENFVLPMSHDEVVHGKGSLASRMPGDEWQRLATLRALFGYMFAQPGKKLLFMGSELGQWQEWNHERQLDWQLLESPLHAGLQRWVQDLNRVYRREPALHELDFSQEGFSWVDCNDDKHSVISFTRRGKQRDEVILTVCNFTPVPRYRYRIGVPAAGHWTELLNSDATDYGGSGQGNLGGARAVSMRYHDLDYSLLLTLPPLSVLYFKHDRAANSLRVKV